MSPRGHAGKAHTLRDFAARVQTDTRDARRQLEEIDARTPKRGLLQMAADEMLADI